MLQRMDQKPDNDDQIDSDDLRKLGDDGPVRRPGNLGDEVPEEADVTFPETVPAPAAQM